jgi:ribosomal-protein-alanine N-acetyltransferase
MQLSTPRLVLRAPTTADAPALFRIRSNESVNKYLGRAPATNEADARIFIEKILVGIEDGKSFYWAIIVKEEPGEPVGTICIYNLEPVENRAEIGFELLPEFQGRGLMREALTVVLDFAQNKLQLQTTVGVFHPDNNSSKKILTAAGFIPDPDFTILSEAEAEGMLVYYLQSPLP